MSAPAPLGDIQVAIGNDYNFLNFASANSNSWAGSRHWKFAPKRQVTENPLVTASKKVDEGMEVEALAQPQAVKSKSSEKKNCFLLSFSSGASTTDAFKVDEKKANSNLLTTAALEKASQLALEGAHTLPVDAKLGPKDLCRLFLSPTMIIPPPSLRSIMSVAPNSSGSKAMASLLAGRKDTMWGELQPEVREKLNNFSASVPQTRQEYLDADEDDVDGYYDDDACGDDTEEFRLVNAVDQNSEPAAEGLQIRVNGMLQASRKVDKVDIGYDFFVSNFTFLISRIA